MTDNEQGVRRIPLSPLRVLPNVADATTVVRSGGETVEISVLCDRACIPYRVTGGFPPLVVLCESGGEVRGRLRDGRECFVVDTSELPSVDPDRSMRILELLVRIFACYQAEMCICDRGYFSPDISMTYSGEVIIEGDDQ